MKGLKKLALVSAIAAVSAGAQAELKALDDSAMGELTGQAGLTIDVETKFTIGEFAYKDGGFVILQGISLGANDSSNTTFGTGLGEQRGSTSMLDNYRIDIDVANAGEVLNHGNSDVSRLAGAHVLNGNSDGGMLLAAQSLLTSGASAAFDAVTSLAFEDAQTYDDGDLLIHFTFTDAWQQGGGFAAYNNGTGQDGAGNATASLATLGYLPAREMVLRSVDFNFSIDMIGIASSTYTVGSQGIESTLNAVTGEINGTNHSTGLDTTPATTALISGLSINGFLGISDLHIENDGNGFGADGSMRDSDGDGIGDVAGTGNADSQIIWGHYTNVTDLDVYIDIAGVQITDLKINNTRGSLADINGNTSLGFAHSIQTIYAVKDTVLHVNAVSAAGSTNTAHYQDGVAINTRFVGDMEIGALSFGDTGESIGELYWTDIDSTTNWTISAH